MFTEQGLNTAPFLVAEVLEVIKQNHPAKVRVWYYCTIDRKGSVYGNGKFARMNSADGSDDTGIESETCILTTFKKLNSGGKLPKPVKRIISESNLLNYSFENKRSKNKNVRFNEIEDISTDDTEG